MLSDGQWVELEPLVEACRPKGKTAAGGAAAHAVGDPVAPPERGQVAGDPAGVGTLVQAAQLFVRWVHAGVWERLLDMAQERGARLGIVSLDGTTIRAHQKAAGARRRGFPSRARSS